MTAHRDELGVVCTHGQLERVCEVCELTVERDALAAALRAIAEWESDGHCLPGCDKFAHEDLCPYCNPDAVLQHMARAALEGKP